MKTICRVFFLLFLFACNSRNSGQIEIKKAANKPENKRPVSVESGKIFKVNGEKMLYGGDDSLQHFNISNCELNDENFHYGIGREKFPALLEPSFISLSEADAIWPDTSRFMVASSMNEVKAYSIKDLTHHEVVNDMLNGKPIMAAYCILADLGTIYERTYNDRIFTYALSGYTYYDDNVWNGLDGFVLWDRETESLWWPLTGNAVSGPMHGVKLTELDKNLWEDTKWGEIKKKYPNVKVLKSGQDFERPKTWKKYADVADIVLKYSK